MFDTSFFQSPAFTWGVLPLLIFLARIVDVSLQTLRVIFINRSMKQVAPLVGFFEVLVWLLAIGQIMRNLNNVACYLAYAFGFAAGTYVGIWLEGKLSLGNVIVRLITSSPAEELLGHLRAQNYGVTSIDAEGIGPVKLIFMVLKRQDLRRVVKMIEAFQPNAFYSVEDVRLVREGVFPVRGRAGLENPSNLVRMSERR